MYRFLAIMLLLSSALLGREIDSAEEAKALRMIIVRDEQSAQTVLKKLQNGASFSGLAGSESIGPERQTWGYSGVVQFDDVRPELRSVIRKLAPGQISGVLKLGQRFVIVKVIAPALEAHYAAADRLVRENHPEQAIRELKIALRLEEDSIETHLRLAALYDTAKRYEEATRHLEKAQTYAPQSVQVTILRGATYMRGAIEQNNQTYARKALQAYDDAAKMDERFLPAIHFGKGKIYLLVLKQPEKALVHLEKAVAITPNVPEVYQLLIQANYDAQRYQKAWQHLRMAQSLGFEFPELRDALYKATPRQQ